MPKKTTLFFLMILFGAYVNCAEIKDRAESFLKLYTIDNLPKTDENSIVKKLSEEQRECLINIFENLYIVLATKIRIRDISDADKECEFLLAAKALRVYNHIYERSQDLLIDLNLIDLIDEIAESSLKIEEVLFLVQLYKNFLKINTEIYYIEKQAVPITIDMNQFVSREIDMSKLQFAFA